MHMYIKSKVYSKVPITCCRKRGQQHLSPRDIYQDFCMEIDIPANDKFFNRGLIKDMVHRCMNYVRSATAMRSDCTFGPKEQVITK